ncbi:hypothetical protein GCM10010425_80490 [Streptomyces spororaveus]|uniref:Uncharacterized protein n=1 Tax=Streptomyces spororaveus TaxID=284039 RepID=A0ABQ3T2Y8_9ACTN|nr:hypothetical protein Sspor_03140 [Streptomyces spororaveus]
MTGKSRNLIEGPIRMRSWRGHCDRSPNDSFRDRQALMTHRREQKTASERRSTPATQTVPHSGHATRPDPFNSAITRRRNRRSRRHDLARHAVEQNTASGRAAGLNRPPQPPHTRTPGRPEPSDTTTG